MFGYSILPIWVWNLSMYKVKYAFEKDTARKYTRTLFEGWKCRPSFCFYLLWTVRIEFCWLLPQHMTQKTFVVWVPGTNHAWSSVHSSWISSFYEQVKPIWVGLLLLAAKWVPTNFAPFMNCFILYKIFLLTVESINVKTMWQQYPIVFCVPPCAGIHEPLQIVCLN
jgi:hypothetical protein